MIELQQTDTGIYYLHEYISSRNFRHHSEEENEISRQIWAYKDGDDQTLQTFTNELMEAITEISRSFTSQKIGLVAVPPSKINKQSTIRTSIWNIKQWYDQGITVNVFGCDKQIYDYGELLTRNKDIPSAHNDNSSRNYDIQHDSISCSRDHLSRYYTTFIILDDVTTSGNSMQVCRNILLEHGAKERYIYCLALAKTIGY